MTEQGVLRPISEKRPADICTCPFCDTLYYWHTDSHLERRFCYDYGMLSVSDDPFAVVILCIKGC